MPSNGMAASSGSGNHGAEQTGNVDLHNKFAKSILGLLKLYWIVKEAGLVAGWRATSPAGPQFAVERGRLLREELFRTTGTIAQEVKSRDAN